MTKLYNRFLYTDLRKKLRNDATRAEQKLWYFLKSSQTRVRFRRQYGVGRYILDFYSREQRLAIEVDGDIHGVESVKLNDEIRQQWIESVGIRMLRFTNDEVLCNIEGVLEAITDAIETSHRSSRRPNPL